MNDMYIILLGRRYVHPVTFGTLVTRSSAIQALASCSRHTGHRFKEGFVYKDRYNRVNLEEI